MKKKKIDILNTDTAPGTKWSRLPLVYKIIIVVLIATLIFIPILA